MVRGVSLDPRAHLRQLQQALARTPRGRVVNGLYHIDQKSVCDSAISRVKGAKISAENSK